MGQQAVRWSWLLKLRPGHEINPSTMCALVLQVHQHPWLGHWLTALILHPSTLHGCFVHLNWFRSCMP